MKFSLFQKKSKEAAKEVPQKEQTLATVDPEGAGWAAADELQLSNLPENPNEKRFHRKKRKVIKEEEKKVEEEKKAVETRSFFKNPISETQEKDIFAGKDAQNGIMSSFEDDEDGGDMLRISKEIADIFELKDVQYEESAHTVGNHFFEVEPEQKEEVVLEDITHPKEEVPEKTPEYHWGSNSLLKRLRQLTEDLEQVRYYNDSRYCGIEYCDKQVPEVLEVDHRLEFPTYKVFVNGKQKTWNELFEIPIPSGASVTVDTGIALRVPRGIKIELGCEEKASEKFALKQTGSNEVKSGDTIVMDFIAGEGAYLSKIGRLVSCRLIG